MAKVHRRRHRSGRKRRRRGRRRRHLVRRQLVLCEQRMRRRPEAIVCWVWRQVPRLGMIVRIWCVMRSINKYRRHLLRANAFKRRRRIRGWRWLPRPVRASGNSELLVKRETAIVGKVRAPANSGRQRSGTAALRLLESWCCTGLLGRRRLAHREGRTSMGAMRCLAPALAGCLRANTNYEYQLATITPFRSAFSKLNIMASLKW